MKWLIASDIHGDSACCEKLLAAFEREKCERLLLLGDLLYHGPRNDLPGGYAPKSVIEQLNSLAEKITCVRGNCDTEVDQQVLEFPIMAEYVWLESGDRMIFATHGHHYGPDRPPLNLGKGDILLCGHTHIPACEKRGGYVYCNPGSVSIPKGGSARGYMVSENGVFTWKRLDGEIFMRFGTEGERNV
ncbi:MAG: phosphodiesterase [Clostridia bacterium]|nr:phosphodiesterase [Clostridia bacterium]